MSTALGRGGGSGWDVHSVRRLAVDFDCSEWDFVSQIIDCGRVSVGHGHFGGHVKLVWKENGPG